MRPLQYIKARSGKHTELVNRRTLITLAIVTMVLLWLLKPNNALLLSLLEQSDDSAVAIAFIRVMQQEQSSPALDYILAKHQYRAGEKQSALQRLQPLNKFAQTPYSVAAQQLYALILLNLSNSNDDARRQLRDYLRSLPADLPLEFQQQLVDYALQIAEPALALNIARRSGQLSSNKLLALALSADQPLQAAYFAGQQYQKQPTQAHLLQLLPLLESADKGKPALLLAQQHLQQQACDSDCLQYLIGLALRNNATAAALAFAETKVQLSQAVADLHQASQLAEANAELAKATRYLEQVSAKAPSPEVYQKLHQYYRWQQHTAKALQISRTLLQLKPDNAVIYAGLEDARAESDLGAKADFYYALAKTKALTDEQVLAFVDANDKAYGAHDTIDKLQQLLTLRPGSARLIAQLGRFYQFVGQPEKTVQVWSLYQQAGSLRYDEAQWFAKAFNSLGQHKQALVLLHQAGQSTRLNTSQLEELLDLAGYAADLPLQRYYQHQLLQQPDNVLDTYLAVATHSEMTTDDQAFLWQLYQQTKALNILAALINFAITQQDPVLVAKTAVQLAQQHDNSLPQVQQLQLYIALHQQDYSLASRLLKQLLNKPPVMADTLRSAAWLALLLNDADWLGKLYPALVRQSVDDADQLRLLAAIAQALGRYQEAGYWQHRLSQHRDYTAQDQLNYALLAEHIGQQQLAWQLRWQAVSRLSQQLQLSADSQLSYQSLLISLVSPAVGNASLLHDLQQQPTANILSLLAQGTLARNLAAQQFWQQNLRDNGQAINDSLSLAIALAKRDIATVTALAYGDNALSATERAGALQQIGHTAAAWQLLEQHNNASVPVLQRSPLQRLAVALHPIRSHGWRSEFRQLDSWQLQQWQLRYYQPWADGQWQISASHITGNQSRQQANNDSSKLLNLSWQTPLADDDMMFSANVALRQRLGQMTSAQQLALSFASAADWRHAVQISHNMTTEQSKNSFLFAQEDRLSWQPQWQLSRYHQVSASLAVARLSTDFNEPIADQSQLQLRLSEQLSRAPQWQIYSQLDVQHSRLSAENFARLSAYNGQQYSAADFTAPRYQRWSVGQQLARGVVGEPGPQAPHYRYLLDTAVGYNFMTTDLDFSLSAGFGARLFGNDELFIKANWQSADRSGQENISLNVGYFIDF